MTKWINYHHLYYFKTIAEEGSVSKAATRLRLGQPTLSAQLKQFEDALGIKLFEREHKKLIITEQGKIALDYARSIFKIGSEMLEVLNDRIRPTRPAICIAALDSVPKQVVLRIAKAALKITPCHLTLIEGNSDELLRELTSHRADLFLTNFLPTALSTKGLSHRRIAKNRVGIYAHKKYIKLRSGFPKTLEGQPMILPTYDSRMRYDLDHWAAANKISFDTVAESQDIAVKKLMAVEGLGLLPAAPHSVTHQVLGGELFELGKLEGVTEELFLVSASRTIENPISKELMRSFDV